jgi:hypothetical protein
VKIVPTIRSRLCAGARLTSCGAEHHARAHEPRWIRVRPDENLDFPGLEHGPQIETQEAQLRRRHPQPSRAGRTGLER